MRGATFSPDSRWLVTSKDQTGATQFSGPDERTAMLWDLTRRDVRLKPVAELPMIGGGINAAFSPDNHWLVIGTQLWDMNANDPPTSTFNLPIISTIPNPKVGPSLISSDSRWAIVAANNNVSIYPVRLDELLRIAAKAASRNLTPEEWRHLFPRQKYRKVFERLP